MGSEQKRLGSTDGFRPTEAEVRAYLVSLVQNPALDASDRNRRFLSYVVEETLAGRGDRIKAYNIALAAFERGEDFDPLTDPIVRIEASRLRRALEHYYLTEGASDPIRIGIPKGSYVAAFHYARPAPIAEAAPLPDIALPKPPPVHEQKKKTSARPRWLYAWIGIGLAIVLVAALAIVGMHIGREYPNAGAPRGPSILVLPFDGAGSDPAHAVVARGVTYETIAELTRFNDLFVFGPETSFGARRTDQNGRAPASIDADYVLSGSVHATSSKVRVSAILMDSRTGQYLWSWNVDRDLNTTSLLDIETDIASQVAGAIAQPYGIVFDRTVREAASKPTAKLASYECVAMFRQYWRSYSERDFDTVRDCLEHAIEADPQYARAYSSLALLYVDTYRFGFGRGGVTVDPLQRAWQLAQKAVQLEPNSSDSYLALSMAYWFSNDIDKSIQAAQRGLRLNPHNTDLLAELGFRYALLAKWDLAMPLIAEAYARNPGSPTGYHIATFLNAYMHGDFRHALEEAVQADAPYVLYGHIARAMAYAKVGDKDKAAAAVSEILKIDPDYGAHVTDDLAKRHIDPSIVQAVVNGLNEAGLPAR